MRSNPMDSRARRRLAFRPRLDALEGRALMASLPPGFVETAVATGLTSPTAMEFSPDGSLFVAEQGGTMEVFRAGARLQANFFRDSPISVDSNGERGLLGVALDPAFATNRFVYVYYTATSPTVHNRVSRFTADASGTLALAGSESVLLEIDPLSSATNHNGGSIHFGPDGKLYVAVGDNANGANSQSLANLKGKILRINADGSIPADNPFFATAAGVNRAIWALGLRNPFTFTFQAGTGRKFINDVGQSTFEEIDQGAAGANYGWPITEGATSDPRFVGPFHAYGRNEGQAITGGAFYNPSANRFPADYAGDYFFADFVAGSIRRIDTTTRAVTAFATGANGPVDLRVRDDGALYYLSRGLGQVLRVDTTAAPPNTSRFTIRTDPPGLPLTFDGRSFAAPATFEGAVGAVHTVEAAPTLTIGGATFAFVSWSDGGAARHVLASPAGDVDITATYQLVAARVNFQPAAAQVPTQYAADAGALFGPRGGGLTFGWNLRNAASARDRNSARSPDQRYDTLQRFRSASQRWEIAVPAGIYSVRIVSGDPGAFGRRIRFTVEGKAGIAGRTTRSARWVDRTISVAVGDGRLTIRSPSASPINFVEITRLSS